MHPIEASSSLIGLIIFVGAIAFQIFSSMSRGKVEPEPPTGSSPLPVGQSASPPPVPPVSQPALTPSRVRMTGVSIDGQTKPLSAESVPPRIQVPAPAVRKAYAVCPPPVPISQQDDPAGLIQHSGEALYQTAVEKMQYSINLGSFSPTTAEKPGEDRMAWLQKRLVDRTEMQRAIILSEIISVPLALR